jgi:hypothetical protein
LSRRDGRERLTEGVPEGGRVLRIGEGRQVDRPSVGDERLAAACPRPRLRRAQRLPHRDPANPGVEPARIAKSAEPPERFERDLLRHVGGGSRSPSTAVASGTVVRPTRSTSRRLASRSPPRALTTCRWSSSVTTCKWPGEAVFLARRDRGVARAGTDDRLGKLPRRGRA